MLASMGKHCHSILFLPGCVGRAAQGPEWASLEELRKWVPGTGSWVGCSLHTQRQPETQYTCGCKEGGLQAPGR